MEERIESFYEKNYKKLIIIPVLILILSLGFLIFNYVSTGEIIQRDVELKGGLEITINHAGLTSNEVESILSTKYEDFSVRELGDFSSRKSLGVKINIADVPEQEIKDLLSSNLVFTEEQYNTRVINPTFAESFYRSLILVLIISFILMAITVLISFRTFIPSVAVILAAVIDIIATLAIINIFGIKLSGPVITALLLIIGYSIDTDVLLTTRMLKRKENTLLKRMIGAMKTGLTMSLTTMIAMLAAFFFAINPVLKEIFLIIAIAVIIDIIATYLANAPILLWYAKKRNIE